MPSTDINVLRAKFFAEFSLKIRDDESKRNEQVEKWKKLYFDMQKELIEFRYKVSEQEKDYQSTLEDVESLHQLELLKLG